MLPKTEKNDPQTFQDLVKKIKNSTEFTDTENIKSCLTIENTPSDLLEIIYNPYEEKELIRYKIIHSWIPIAIINGITSTIDVAQDLLGNPKPLHCYPLILIAPFTFSVLMGILMIIFKENKIEQIKKSITNEHKKMIQYIIQNKIKQKNQI